MATQPPQAKKSILHEFRDFLNQGDFVTIAVGLIIALYFQKIVDSILVGVMFPIIAAIFGKPDFQDIGFDICDARISIGLVINAIVSFIVVAALLFLILKAYNKVTHGQATAPPSEVALLGGILEEMRGLRAEIAAGGGPNDAPPAGS